MDSSSSEGCRRLRLRTLVGAAADVDVCCPGGGTTLVLGGGGVVGRRLALGSRLSRVELRNTNPLDDLENWDGSQLDR